MAQVTLMKVAAEAIHNEAFFNGLMKDIAKALAEKGWTLSESDLEKLKKALQVPPVYVKIDLPKFLKGLFQKGFAGYEWMGIEWIDIDKLNKPQQ